MRKMEVEDQNQRVGTVRRRMKVAIFFIKLIRTSKCFILVKYSIYRPRNENLNLNLFLYKTEKFTGPNKV